MSPTAASDSIAHALQQLQKDSQQQQVITKHVKSIEAKLNALEGSVLTAGEGSCIKLPFAGRDEHADARQVFGAKETCQAAAVFAACFCIPDFCSLTSCFGTK